jgi:hypothetical protein
MTRIAINFLAEAGLVLGGKATQASSFSSYAEMH